MGHIKSTGVPFKRSIFSKSESKLKPKETVPLNDFLNQLQKEKEAREKRKQVK